MPEFFTHTHEQNIATPHQSGDSGTAAASAALLDDTGSYYKQTCAMSESENVAQRRYITGASAIGLVVGAIAGKGAGAMAGAAFGYYVSSSQIDKRNDGLQQKCHGDLNLNR